VNLAIDSLRRKGRCVEVELDDAIPCSLPSPRANYQRTEIRQQFAKSFSVACEKHETVADGTAVLLKRLSGNPDVEARAEFEDAQRPEESFREFVGIGPASR
jgi:hypothetical protein